MSDQKPTEPTTDRLERGCRCVATIKEKLTKHHGEDSDVCLTLAPTINMDTLAIGAALPPLAYTYRAGKKRRKSYVTFKFCPFCGQKN